MARIQSAALVLVALLLAGLVLAPVAAQQSQPETDNTVTRIVVHADGSARWTIRIRTRLDTAARLEEYEAFQAGFRNDSDRYLAVFRDRMRGVVANAANATGREMAATDFAASTSIQEVPRRWGIVSYAFTWREFAETSNGSVAVGDVFQGGFFIAANDTLRIDAPANHTVRVVEPEPTSADDGVLTWAGRVDFADRHPRVVFAPEATDGTGTTAPPPSAGGSGPWLLLAVGALLAVVAGAGYVRHRRDGDQGADPAPDVLTDEERVRRLLEEHDGRVRQGDVADELDWSASKTSRVVGGMVEDGTVEKLQLGRENLLELPDEE